MERHSGRVLPKGSRQVLGGNPRPCFAVRATRGSRPRIESRMRGNSHVRFGAGDEETCPGDGARRFIPTLPADPAELSLSNLVVPRPLLPNACERKRAFDLQIGSGRSSSAGDLGHSWSDGRFAPMIAVQPSDPVSPRRSFIGAAANGWVGVESGRRGRVGRMTALRPYRQFRPSVLRLRSGPHP